MRKYLLPLITLCSLSLQAQPGSLDPSFGQAGLVVSSFLPSTDSYAEMAADASGRLYVAGHSGFGFNYLLARYTPDGIPDSSFGGEGWETYDRAGSTDQARCLALQADGRALIGGGSVGSDRDWGILRVDSAGQPDSSFGNAGWALIGWGGFDEVSDLLVLSDGKILAAGGGNFTFALARLKPNGSLDSSFGTQGRVSLAEGGSPRIAVGADGSIFAADVFNQGGNSRFGVLKFTPDGQLDNSFGSGGKALSDVSSFPINPMIALQPDGKILVGGTASNQAGQGSGAALARFLASGSPDPSFSGDGKLLISSGNATEGNGMALLPNGHILVAGAATPNGNADMALFCVRPEGTLDSGFGNGGITTVHIPDGGLGEWGKSVALQADGKIVVGGTHFGAFSQVALFRVRGGGLSGLADTEWQGAFSAYPSPARGSLLLRAELPEAAALAFQLCDLSGRVVKEWAFGLRPAGIHEIPIALPGEALPGLYVGRLTAGERALSCRVLVE